MTILKKLSKNYLNSVESYAACMCAKVVMCSCGCECTCNCSNSIENLNIAKTNIANGSNVPRSNATSGNMGYQRQHG